MRLWARRVSQGASRRHGQALASGGGRGRGARGGSRRPYAPPPSLLVAMAIENWWRSRTGGDGDGELEVRDRPQPEPSSARAAEEATGSAGDSADRRGESPPEASPPEKVARGRGAKKP